MFEFVFDLRDKNKYLCSSTQLESSADEETKTAESTDGRGESISLEEETTRMALLLGSISKSGGRGGGERDGKALLSVGGGGGKVRHCSQWGGGGGKVRHCSQWGDGGEREGKTLLSVGGREGKALLSVGGGREGKALLSVRVEREGKALLSVGGGEGR